MTLQVFLCVSAFDSIRSEAAAWRDLETGGILLGYETKDAVVITEATGPGPACVRAPFAVELDTRFITATTDRAAEMGLQYQGSWHTHPTRGPLLPSAADRRLLRSGAWSSRYQLNLAAVMFILRPSVTSIDGFAAYLCRKRRLRLEAVGIVLTNDPQLS